MVVEACTSAHLVGLDGLVGRQRDRLPARIDPAHRHDVSGITVDGVDRALLRALRSAGARGLHLAADLQRDGATGVGGARERIEPEVVAGRIGLGLALVARSGPRVSLIE